MIYPRLQFLTQFLKYPRTIGSITPSSSFLAKAMVTPVSWEDTEVVVELGAGTGIFTKYIEQNMKPASRAYIFEKNLPLQKNLSNATLLFLTIQMQKICPLFCAKQERKVPMSLSLVFPLLYFLKN